MLGKDCSFTVGVLAGHETEEDVVVQRGAERSVSYDEIASLNAEAETRTEMDKEQLKPFGEHR